MNKTNIRRWLSFWLPGTLPLIIIMGFWFYGMEVPRVADSSLSSAALADLGGLSSHDPLGLTFIKLFLALFVHASAPHFLNNAVFLFVAGVFLQMVPVRYWVSIAAFILSGVIGNLSWLVLMWHLNGQEVLVGASGGIYGVMGCAWAILASLVVKRIKYTDDPVFGTYGMYGFKFIAATLTLLILLSGNTITGDIFTVLVHSVGVLVGLIFGRVVYLATFTGRSYQDAIKARYEANIRRKEGEAPSRMQKYHKR